MDAGEAGKGTPYYSEDLRLTGGGLLSPGEVHVTHGDAGASGDGDGIQFFEKAELYGVGVVGEEAFAIFVVERVINVGFEIELQLFFGEIHFRGSFFADGVEIFETVV